MELKTESPVRARSEPSSLEKAQNLALEKCLPSQMGKEHLGRNADGVDHGIIFFGTLFGELHSTRHKSMPHQGKHAPGMKTGDFLLFDNRFVKGFQSLAQAKLAGGHQ
jgi:hypothetical protein